MMHRTEGTGCLLLLLVASPKKGEEQIFEKKMVVDVVFEG